MQEFDVYEVPTSSGKVLAIKICLQSFEYDTVYVRIVVRPSGGPFQFANTGHAEFPSGIAGKWMFKEVDVGTVHFAYWPGDTNGPDFCGNNEEYEFCLVAVDRGGNVSEEYSCKVNIDWR